MNAATLNAFRALAEAMHNDKNHAVQIEVDGHWQTVIDRLAMDEAKQFAGRWERSRIVKVASV